MVISVQAKNFVMPKERLFRMFNNNWTKAACYFRVIKYNINIRE